MGYYAALFLVIVFSALMGWWLNDWWKQLKEPDEEEPDGEDR